MIDRFGTGIQLGAASTLTSSATRGVTVAPSDTADLPFVTRGLWIGTGGNVAVTLADDADPVTIVSVAAGSLLPLRARRVMATGTTAQNIVAVD